VLVAKDSAGNVTAIGVPAASFAKKIGLRPPNGGTVEAIDVALSSKREPVWIEISWRVLMVTIDPQRYSCLKRGRRYRDESLDGDFVRDIEVDADGLVLTYAGLFRRVL
jgi:putative glycolipid-binding protein